MLLDTISQVTYLCSFECFSLFFRMGDFHFIVLFVFSMILGSSRKKILLQIVCILITKPPIFVVLISLIWFPICPRIVVSSFFKTLNLLRVYNYSSKSLSVNFHSLVISRIIFITWVFSWHCITFSVLFVCLFPICSFLNIHSGQF